MAVPFIYSFQYLGVLIGVADKIASLKFNELKDIKDVLKDNLKDTEIIAKNSKSIVENATKRIENNNSKL